MATFTSTAAQTNSGGFFLNPPKYLEQGVVARSANYVKTAAESVGDVYLMVPIPRGAQMIDVILQPAMGGGAVTMNCGDSGSATRYGSLSCNGTLAVHALNGVGYSYSVDDVIKLAVGTATSASAVGSFRLTCLYQFDNATDGNG